MDILFAPFFNVLYVAIDAYILGLAVYGALYLMVAFDLLKAKNPIVFKVQTFLFALYDPLLDIIRKAVPFKVDISFIVLYLALYFIRAVIARMA